MPPYRAHYTRNLTSSKKPELHNVFYNAAPEKDRVTAMQQTRTENHGEARGFGFRDMLAYRQTDRQTDTLIAILRTPTGAQ